jgi:HEAT repeat protein
MTGVERARIAVLIIFSVDALMVIGLIALKTIHRRLAQSHERRRSGYVALISRHIAYENCTDPITRETAEDPAFVDALIDVRNAVVGPEAEIVHQIVDRYGVAKRLSRHLRSDFWLGRRLRAAVALAEIGDESSAETLTAFLDDPEPEIRIQAARGLGRMRWKPAIDRIIARFSIETPWVRARFADTLIGFGREATSPLIAYVRANHRFEQAGSVSAIATLAAIGDDQAVEPLIELLQSAEDTEVKISTVEALGYVGGAMAAPALRSIFKDRDWRVRAKAATALGEVGETASIGALTAALRDQNWWVRRNSAAALVRISGGIDALYRALGDDDPFAADAAAEALTDHGELMRARERVQSGQATDDDIALLRHMIGEGALT